ncbi:MAG: iron-containing alcohol dehydrogenase [Firmicutes bacterium]|nr:iron-containing alcohol dehydrogenase [Bacillota bacterium]
MLARFRFAMPTKVFFGQGCVKNQRSEWVLGSKALIVTGRSSAKLSGALDDVLDSIGVDYEVFSEVENNPSLATVAQGGRAAREAGCDFVVAIGGGSPLDAAKVIAVLARNEKDPLDLYSQGWENRALPVVAIPTTAGTGSEVTQYAVLTIERDRTKRGLGGFDMFPAVALLDPTYTESLSADVTIDTAVDALSHLVEGYLSLKADAINSSLAVQGMRMWGRCIPALRNRGFDRKVRAELMVASTLGGMTIAQTSTTVLHAMGYPLTYFHGIPHGQANGILFAAYLRYVHQTAPQKVGEVLVNLGLTSLNEFQQLMEDLFKDKRRALKVDEEVLPAWAQRAAATKNAANSIGNPSPRAVEEIFRKSLLR